MSIPKLLQEKAFTVGKFYGGKITTKEAFRALFRKYG
jgi:hypothetical protein